MCSILKTGLHSVLTISLAILFSYPAHALEMMCAHSPIVVIASHKNDLESVCNAAEKGITYLKSIEIAFQGPLTIRLVKEITKSDCECAIGLYDARSNEINILSYAAAARNAPNPSRTFGVAMTPEIWDSYIIHELTHAALQNAFTQGVPVHTAHEYIAAVVQIATLPTGERDKLFNNYPELTGFTKTAGITYTYYLLDPNRFAINAYLHFLKPEHGIPFVQKLLREGLPDN